MATDPALTARYRFIEPRVDFLDARTGKISRQWYLFLESLYSQAQAAGSKSADSQPLNANLTDISALVTTAYGRGFLTLVDAAAGRTTLSLGTLATQNGTYGNVIAADAAADTTTWVLLATNQTGDQQPRTDAGLTFNASTNTLGVGNITGLAATFAISALPTGVVSLVTGLGAVAVDVGDNGVSTTLAFYGGTRRVRAAAYIQTYAVASRTVPTAVGSDVVTTAATLAAYGFTLAQANSIPIEINNLRTEVATLKQLVNSLINDSSATLGVGLNAT